MAECGKIWDDEISTLLASWGEQSNQDQLMGPLRNSNKPFNAINRELQHFVQQSANTVKKNTLSSCCLEVKRKSVIF
jgi:hypothetical protein